MTFQIHNRPAAKAVIALTIAAAAASCIKEVPADAIVAVGNATLTLSDLRKAIPAGLSATDSATFAESYINSWISDMLITEIAEKNIPDTRSIDRMTDDYRRQLIMWEYQRLKTAQDGPPELPEDTIAAYYDRHHAEMRVEPPMVRGILVKIPTSSPLLENVRKWYRSDKDTDIELLEKANIKDDDILYEYFRDNWVKWEQIESRVPHNFSGRTPKTGEHIEVSDGDFTYLLHITETLTEGTEMPRDVAEPIIRDRLTARHKLSLDRRLRQELYQQALENGKIKRY